jgi:hypothetical protein
MSTVEVKFFVSPVKYDLSICCLTIIATVIQTIMINTQAIFLLLEIIGERRQVKSIKNGVSPSTNENKSVVLNCPPNSVT